MDEQEKLERIATYIDERVDVDVTIDKEINVKFIWTQKDKELVFHQGNYKPQQFINYLARYIVDDFSELGGRESNNKTKEEMGKRLKIVMEGKRTPRKLKDVILEGLKGVGCVQILTCWIDKEGELNKFAKKPEHNDTTDEIMNEIKSYISKGRV